MRVTNNMIMRNAQGNIGGTKEIVNNRNTQMTTQKKISRPSDDPVIAIRSLRLGTSLSKINQYYEKNIPDGESWIDVSETAMLNMRSLMSDIRTLCVTGSTDTLTQDDRHTIVNQLEALQQQVFLEGNADYAGRTVFTGYRTDQNLVFTDDELTTSYEINQHLTVDNIEQYRFYDGNVVVPTTQDTILNNEISDIVESDYYRVRTAYNKLDDLQEFSYEVAGNKYTFKDLNKADADKITLQDGTGADVIDEKGDPIKYIQAAVTNDPGNSVNSTSEMYIFESEEDWAKYCEYQRGENKKVVGDDNIVVIKDRGEVIFGKNVNNAIQENDGTMDIKYDKTSFSKGELRPEYYFNCTKTHDGPTDSNKAIEYFKFDEDGNAITYDINYMIANNQLLTVNTEASDIISQDIQRDAGEMITAVQRAIAAHDKVETIKGMMKEVMYADQKYQDKLSTWLAAAQKEADYADDNMQKLFSSQIGKTDSYISTLNLGITKLGCASDSLKLTKTRMMDQQQTVEDLQSRNDDIDLSQIILDYTASYTAYQASLTAASKLGQMSLLNYI